MSGSGQKRESPFPESRVGARNLKVILSVEPVRFPLTGIGRYTYELARQLLKSRRFESIKLFSGFRYCQDLPTPEQYGQASTVHGLKHLVQSSSVMMELYRVLMPALRAQALKCDADHLYHGPNFFIPPFPGRSVATFHDLSPFTWSHCHPAKRIRYLQKELRFTLDRADALITDSEFTRQELADFSAWPLEKIHAVPLACSTAFHPRTESELQAPLSRYHLQPGGYSLFVGTIEPRKNVDGLIDAYRHLPVSLRHRWPLVLVGYSGWQSEATHKKIEIAEREGWLRYLGFVDGEDLPLLVAGTRLFVFPSLYEGFGLPILEALRSGVPVICSNSSSLPEVAGPGALMCEPTDIETLAWNIQRGLEDDLWRQGASEMGLAHSAGFSWERCARETIQVYQRVMART